MLIPRCRAGKTLFAMTDLSGHFQEDFPTEEWPTFQWEVVDDRNNEIQADLGFDGPPFRFLSLSSRRMPDLKVY